MNDPGDACRQYGHHSLAGIRRNVAADVRRYLTMSPENIAAGDGFKKRLSAFLRPELQCLLLHRIAHALYLRGLRRTARFVASLNRLAHRVTITPQSCIGPGCRLPHPAGVAFHGRAGEGLTVFVRAACWPAGPFLDGPVEAGPSLGQRVTVGGHAVLIGPVRVGDDVKIGFKAVVQCDVASGATVLSGDVRARVCARDTSPQAAVVPGSSHGSPSTRVGGQGVECQ